MYIKKTLAIALATFVVGLSPVSNARLSAQGYGIYYSPSGAHPIYYGSFLNPGAYRGSPGWGTTGMPDVSGRFIDHTHTVPQVAYGGLYGVPYVDSLAFAYPNTSYLVSGGLIRNAPSAPYTTAPMDYRAQIQLKVPENADVSFGDQRTSQRGQIRTYRTALLEPGKTYQHEVRVTWKVGDRELFVIRPFQYVAGNKIELDLSNAEGGYGIESQTSPSSKAVNASGIVRR